MSRHIAPGADRLPPGGNSVRRSKATGPLSHAQAPSPVEKTVDTSLEISGQKTNVPRVILSEAQRVLNEMGITLGQLAKVTGRTRQGCSKWMRGDGFPDDESRKKIAAHWKEVPPSFWVLPPKGSIPVTVNATDLWSLADLTARDAAGLHLIMIQRLRAAEGATKGANLLRLCELERKAILDFARFNGELSATEESRLTETKRWKEVREMIFKALTYHPEVAREVTEALEAIGA